MKKIRIGMMNIPRVGDTDNRNHKLYRDFGFMVENVTRKQIRDNDLDGFDLLHCPGGHHVVLNQIEIRNIRSFVRRGRGFVGICAGAHFIAHARLLNIRVKIVRASGIYNMRLIRKHPVIRGFRTVPRSPERGGCNPVPHTNLGRLMVDRGNGAFMLAGRGALAIATYDNDDEFAGIIVGSHGRGRVAAFSCHPQVTARYKGISTDRRAHLLLRNAALWCAHES